MPRTAFDRYTYASYALRYTLLVMAKDNTRLKWRMVVQFHGMEYSQEIAVLDFDQRPNRQQMTRRVKGAWRAWLSQRQNDISNIALEGSVEYDDDIHVGF